MQRSADTPAIAMQVTRGVVMASIQVDLTDEVLGRFRDDLLYRVSETDSHGVIFDLSGLVVLDSYEFAGLRKIMAMSAIMGAAPVLVGLRPGVVSALIEAGADVDDIQAASSLDAAFALLEPQSAQPTTLPEDVEVTETESDGTQTLPVTGNL
jgi:anti-anti-sigma regulatory factor